MRIDSYFFLSIINPIQETKTNLLNNKKVITMTTQTIKSKQVQMINALVVNRAPVNIFLINGIKLQGCISQQDETSILLVGGGIPQLVYKKAMATILPQMKQKTPLILSEDENQYTEITVIDDLINSEAHALVYLVNGIKLDGKIVEHDHEMIVLLRNDLNQVVYKHAIASISPYLS